MTHPLIQKIGCYTRLSTDEEQTLHKALSERIRTFEARSDILVENEAPDRVYVLVDGWACRYRSLTDGRRQITSFLLPGDLCDSHLFALARMDHSIASMSAVTASEVTQDILIELTEASPRLARALWWDMLVGTSIQREWTINLGRRDAAERMAHLFVEMLLRLRSVGRAGNHVFDMPATQGDLADALGITTVHVNRTLQSMRSAGLVALERRRLSILDLDGLKRLAMFDRRYLHLDFEGRAFASNEE